MCAASSPQSTSRWPPPASVDTDAAWAGKGEGTEPRTAGKGKLDGVRPGSKARLGMPTTPEDTCPHPALFECMFFCAIPVIGFTCSFQTWGWVGAGGQNVLFFHEVVWFFPVIHPTEHITLKPYCSPKRGGPGGGAPRIHSAGNTLPPHRQWGKSTPPMTCATDRGAGWG